MAKKDPEAAKMAAEQHKQELEKTLAEIKSRLARVPDFVLNGSFQVALAFKAAAAQGQKLIESKKPNLQTAKACAAELSRFYNNGKLL